MRQLEVEVGVALLDRSRHHVALTGAGRAFLPNPSGRYFGPQMLGILRDLTGSFAAGFYMVAIADVLTLTLIAALYRMTRGATHV